MEEPTNTLTIAPLWRRGLGAGLDALLLTLIGNLLGALYRNEFIAFGYGGRMIGLFLFCAYIGGQNSLLGRGQTFGKRLARTRVVDANGQLLALERGMLRAFVLALPLLTSGIFVAEASPFTSLVLTGLLSVISVGLGGAIVYLYLFNRGTGQSAHDLIAGSFVVIANQADGAPPRRTVWRGHLVVLGLWLLLPLSVGPTLWWFWSGGFDWQKVFRLQQTLQESIGTQRVEVMHGQFNFLTADGSKAAARYLQVGAYYPKRLDSFEDAADEIATIVLTDPAAQETDAIRITVAYGFDILIASRFWSQSFVRSPADWQQHLRDKGLVTPPTQARHLLSPPSSAMGLLAMVRPWR